MGRDAREDTGLPARAEPGADRELRASENRLKVLLGCTKGIVFEFDREARYLYVWTHDDDLLARPAPELIGRTIDEVLGEAGRRFTEVVRRVYATGTPETIEYELTVRGGRRWFTADVTVSPVVAGRDPTVVYLVRDVTAHKHLEEQLRQAQKVEAIGKLAGGIAHDFNNILTTIMGYSEMLLAGIDQTSAHHKHAARIRHAAERASAMTSQLLAYGRKRVLVTEVLDVNDVISSMGHMLRQLIGEHIELRFDLDPGLGGAKADRSGFEQIIMNLALNARDALATGGLLTLRTANVELDEAFCAQQLEVTPGRYVLIVVSDNGHGMDAETRAQIFEPFFTTKELGKGTGLGLSTVFGIVKQSGGHIEVESAPGRGASFRVHLPRVERSVRRSLAAAAGPAPAACRLTVLVAEDDADVRQLIHDYLMSAGYDVLLAADPVQALDLARSRTIDLLVTDVVMPTMGGDVLAKRLRKIQPRVRVLYISGYPDGARDGRLPRVANSRFLQKPFTRSVLVEQVGALQAGPDQAGPDADG